MKIIACILLVGACVTAIAGLPVSGGATWWSQSGKFEGDILLHGSQLEKNGVTDARLYWPNRIMYFNIAGGIFTQAEIDTIYGAINEYNTRTCVRLVQRTNEADYVQIGGSQSGCYSYVGKIGGAQELNLGQGCRWHGIAVHEMLHALGFWHMQSTHNRDDYVTIQWQNIQAGTESNFDKYTTEQVTDFGVTYDYGSVMHYGNYDFSSNGQPTIIAHPDSSQVLGQGPEVGLQPKDIQKLNAMYGC